MTATKQLDKESLKKYIQNFTNWSENLLNGMKLDSLQEIYDYILDGDNIQKARVTLNLHSYLINFRVPMPIMIELGLSYGDRFDIKVSVDKNEVRLVPNGRQVKIGKNNTILLPKGLVDKRFLRAKDDVLVRVDGDRIVLKSFTYFQ